MFNKQNFCHVASNNRNNQKAGLFLYKTTDDLETVLASGYFNDKIIDINLHDLIIHEYHDPADRTKTQINVLCVIERTLDNVGTDVVLSKWEGQIETDIEELQEYVDSTFVKKSGDVMTGRLALRDYFAFQETAGGTALYMLQYNTNNIKFYQGLINNNIQMYLGDANVSIYPGISGYGTVGKPTARWANIYVAKINNGGNLIVPSVTGTLATKEDVDLVANSGGIMITQQGFWYAKMDANSTPGAPLYSTNYADFSQVDGDSNPIIVTYNAIGTATGTQTTGSSLSDIAVNTTTFETQITDAGSYAFEYDGANWTYDGNTVTLADYGITYTGTPVADDVITVTYALAWVQDQTVTPPANTDGYVLITSKIWDIPEQAGQQGGRVMWNHTSKQFTPYPTIVSYDNIVITGNSTVVMPENPGNNQIVNKSYVDTLIATQGGSGRNIGDIFFTSRKDSTLNGAVDCNGNQYNTSDFTGAQSIGALLEAGKIPYMSLSDYATALAADGSVGVFGWDGVGNTAFRVPSLNDIFIETGTSAQVGDYLPAGLPNIEGETQGIGKTDSGQNSGSNTGAIYTKNSGRTGPTGGTTNVNLTSVGINASLSSAIYGNSATVQPNAVRYRAMVQLAGGATDEAVETCTNVLADVATLKSHEVIAFQAPTAGNNYTWYRKYADGWVEQGSSIDSAASGTYTVIFPVTMADTHYTILKTLSTTSSNNAQYHQISFFNKTTTSADTNTAGVGFSWQVSGMAA